MIQELISIVKQADQNSIMLYSQRNGYIFDMTYACHEATEQFKKFKSKAVPFRQMIKKNNVEVARFDSLINYLYGMNTMFLSEEAQVNRNVDLTLAVNIRRQLVEKQKQLQAMYRLTTEPTVSYRHSTTMPTEDTKISRTASSIMEATTICAYSVTSA